MKKKAFLLLSMIALILSNPLLAIDTPEAATKAKDDSSLEKILPKVITAFWAASISVDSACFLSHSLRILLYSQDKCTEITKKDFCEINRILRFFNISTPHKHFSTSPHPFLQKMGGKAFSAYGTLFIDKPVFKKLSQNIMLDDNAIITNIKALDVKTQRELAVALIMLDKHFDAKILASVIITPPLVWALSYGINRLMEKMDTEQQPQWVNSIRSLAKDFNESFFAKALVSNIMLIAYMSYQLRSITVQANSIIEKL